MITLAMIVVGAAFTLVLCSLMWLWEGDEAYRAKTPQLSEQDKWEYENMTVYKNVYGRQEQR